MSSIAPIPRSTPPSLPSQDPLQKKSRKLLTKSNEKVIQAWAKTDPAATNAQIQEYIKNTFGVTYAKRTIQSHKEEWGFTVQAHKARALKPDEVSTLKVWAETHKAAINTEIQTYIRSTFGVTYAKRSLEKQKAKWGFTIQAHKAHKAHKARARTLTNDEINTLKIWAETHKAATLTDIQAYIRSTFGLEYGKISIQRYKAEWGFTVKAQKEQARTLTDDEVNTLKEWAKINPAATNTEIQEHIKNNFGVTYAEGSILRHKAEWGFTAQAHKAHKARARALTDDEVNTLKEWAKTNKAATWQQIQEHIRSTFVVEYAEISIKRHKAEWGFTAQAHKARARALTDDEVNTLKEWAKTNKAATWQQIQAYIRSTFRTTYTENFIKKHKVEWGFTVQARTLEDNEVSKLKAWAKINPTATLAKIQAYIRNNFGVTYAKGSIQHLKRDWGFPLKAEVPVLEENQLRTLRDWAKEHPNATNSQIRAYIKETFNFEYCERSIRRHKKNWGFTVKTQARSLTNDEVNTLKDWAKGHLHATWEEIQAYMRDTFNVVYTKTSTKELKKAWGFAAKGHKASDNSDLDTANFNEFLCSLSLPEDGDPNTDRPISPLVGDDFEEDFEKDFKIDGPPPSFPPVIVQAKALPIVRSLQPDEVNKLRAWAETNKTATWKKIQSYIRNTFGAMYTKENIQRHKADWGFAAKAQAFVRTSS